MTWRRDIRGACTILAAVALLAAHSPGLPVFQSPNLPHRIISLVPAVTEMLFAIGAGDAVVGVSNFDHYPAAVERRTKVGGLVDPDFERILLLKPDLVIVYGTQNELLQRLARAGIPIYSYEHAGLTDITVTVRRIGQRVGHAAEAEREAARVEQGLAELRSRVSGRPRPKTMIVFDREPGTLRGMYASGGIGFLHDMLSIAGGENVFDDVKRPSLQVSTEQVLARAPEVVVELHSGSTWTSAQITRERGVWGTLASVPAVRSGRIFILTDEMMSIPGPRVLDATRVLARTLHPEVVR